MTRPRSYRKFGMKNQTYDCYWFPSQRSNHWASFLISSLFWHCYQLSGPIPQPRRASPSLLLHINPTSQGNISKQSIGTQQSPQPVSLLHFPACPPTNLFLAWSISLNRFYSKVSVSTLLSLRLNIFDPPISRLDGWQNPNSSSKNIHVLEVYSKPKLGFGSRCGFFDLSSDLNAVSCDVSVCSTESRVPICVRALRHDGCLQAPRVGKGTDGSSQIPFGLCSCAMGFFHSCCFVTHLEAQEIWPFDRSKSARNLTVVWRSYCPLPLACFPCSCFPLPRNHITTAPPPLSPVPTQWEHGLVFFPMDGKARASLVLWSFTLTEFQCNSLFPGNYSRFIHHKASNHNNSVILRPKEKM